MKENNIKFHVYFTNSEHLNGQAELRENLISGRISLYLKTSLFMSEVDALIDKTYNYLKLRSENVKYEIHWDTLKNKEEKENE